MPPKRKKGIQRNNDTILERVGGTEGLIYPCQTIRAVGTKILNHQTGDISRRPGGKTWNLGTNGSKWRAIYTSLTVRE